MHAKPAILKLLAPLLTALCLGLAYAGTATAAPGFEGTIQQSDEKPNPDTKQSDEKPDCKKNPDDSRCRKY